MSARGPQGGFVLAIAPDALTLARVVDCFDEPRPPSHCLLSTGPCDAARPCAAHERWAVVTEARREPLPRTTVADLLGDLAHGALHGVRAEGGEPLQLATVTLRPGER